MSDNPKIFHGEKSQIMETAIGLAKCALKDGNPDEALSILSKCSDDIKVAFEKWCPNEYEYLQGMNGVRK